MHLLYIVELHIEPHWTITKKVEASGNRTNHFIMIHQKNPVKYLRNVLRSFLYSRFFFSESLFLILFSRTWGKTETTHPSYQLVCITGCNKRWGKLTHPISHHISSLWSSSVSFHDCLKQSCVMFKAAVCHF